MNSDGFWHFSNPCETQTPCLLPDAGIPAFILLPLSQPDGGSTAIQGDAYHLRFAQSRAGALSAMSSQWHGADGSTTKSIAVAMEPLGGKPLASIKQLLPPCSYPSPRRDHGFKR